MKTNYTQCGSLMDRALQRIAGSPEMSPTEFKRHLLAVCESKTQANRLGDEIVSRGYVQRVVRVTPKFENRTRVGIDR